MRNKKYRFPKTTLKAPIEFVKDDPDFDEEMLCTIILYLHGGLSMKAAYSIVYRPHCAPSSLPPTVSLWFAQPEVKEYIKLFKRYYSTYPYLNPRAWAEK